MIYLVHRAEQTTFICCFLYAETFICNSPVQKTVLFFFIRILLFEFCFCISFVLYRSTVTFIVDPFHLMTKNIILNLKKKNSKSQWTNTNEYSFDRPRFPEIQKFIHECFAVKSVHQIVFVGSREAVERFFDHLDIVDRIHIVCEKDAIPLV